MNEPSLVGQTLGGRYLVEAPIGAGGMGIVYAVRDLQTGARCAVKVLPAALAAEADAVRRFKREATALASVQHRGVVKPLDWGQTSQGAPFLVMELLEGETLAARLERQRALPWPVARAIFLQVGEGLAAAHTAGVLHRDLKPANVFLTRDAAGNECARILDFGLAKALEDPNASKLTATGAVLGTPAYMSPEQALAREVGIPADVYSLATILFEMVSGTAPFAAPTPTAVLARLMSEEAPRLGTLAHGRAPVGTDEVLARALEKKPEARYQRVEAFAAAVVALGDLPAQPPMVQSGHVLSATAMNEMATGPTVAFAATPFSAPASAGFQQRPAPTPSPFGIGPTSQNLPNAGPPHVLHSGYQNPPIAAASSVTPNPKSSLALRLSIAFVVAVGLCVGIVAFAVSQHNADSESAVANPNASVTNTAPAVVAPGIPVVPSVPAIPGFNGVPPNPAIAAVPSVPEAPPDPETGPDPMMMALGRGDYAQCVSAGEAMPPGEVRDQILFGCALSAGRYDVATRACDDLRTSHPQNNTAHSCAQAISSMRRAMALMHGTGAQPSEPSVTAPVAPRIPAGPREEVYNPFSAGQSWRGSYLCGGTPSQVTLEVRSVQQTAVNAVVRFLFGPTGAIGAFLASGNYDARSRHIAFQPGRWVLRPPGMITVGFAGEIAQDGRTFRGTVASPNCSRIEFRR